MYSQRILLSAAVAGVFVAGAAQATTWVDDFVVWSGQDNTARSDYRDTSGANPRAFTVTYNSGGQPSGWLTQEGGTVAKFDDPAGGSDTRWRFSTATPTSMVGTNGIGAAWSMNIMDDTHMVRGPVQVCLTNTGVPEATEYNAYFRIENGIDVYILRNGGSQYAGIDVKTLPSSLADAYHTWTTTAIVQSDALAYWNLWIDGTKIMFTGSDPNGSAGSPTGPDDGLVYSFRTHVDGFSGDPYIGLGDLGSHDYHNFKFDWVAYRDDDNSYFDPTPVWSVQPGATQSFSMPMGGAGPDPVGYTIANDNSVQHVYDIAEVDNQNPPQAYDYDWLSLPVTQVTIPAGQSDSTVTAVIDASGLGHGTYTAYVKFSDDASEAMIRTIVLTVIECGYEVSSPAPDPTDPPIEYTITNVGGDDINYQVEKLDVCDWLSLDVPLGVPIGPLGSGEVDTVTATITPPPRTEDGLYTCDLQFSHDCVTPQVEIRTVTFAQSVSYDLGEDVGLGMSHQQPTDGDTDPVYAGNGVRCRYNRGYGGSPASYFYFRVDDSFAYAGNNPELYITMEYLDTGTTYLELQYDSCADTSDPPASCSTIADRYKGVAGPTLSDTQTWRWFTWQVTDAYFANRQNDSCDFRIYASDTAYLNRIYVSEPLGCKARVTPVDQVVEALQYQAADPIIYTVQNASATDSMSYTVAETEADGVTPADYAWLSLDKSGSAAPLLALGEDLVTASIDTNGAAGAFTGYVTFTDDCDTADPIKHIRRIDLNLIGCQTALTPTTGDYRTVSDTAAPVTGVVYTMHNTGGLATTFTVTKVGDCDWLSLDVPVGVPQALPVAGSVDVTGTIDANGLPVGTHTCELQFADDCTIPAMHSRQVHVSVRDETSIPQWFQAEFWVFDGQDEGSTTPLVEFPSGDEVSVLTGSALAPGDRVYDGWVTQGTIAGAPETTKFAYDGAWARANMSGEVPLDLNYDPAKGMAVAWRLRTGEYVGPCRGPFRIYTSTGAGQEPIAVYFGISDGDRVRMMANCCGCPGDPVSGVNEILLAEKIWTPGGENPDEHYHKWSASSCYNVGDGFAYYNVWLDGEQLLFGGDNGTVVGPGGATYSFRANNTDGGDQARVWMGEAGNSGMETHWDFEFDYVRVISLDVEGCPYWDGEGWTPPPPIWPDTDDDDDVDQDDFAVFQRCYTGDGDPGGAFDAANCAKFNRDDTDDIVPDIDEADYGEFEKCATGPEIPMDPYNPPGDCDLSP